MHAYLASQVRDAEAPFLAAGAPLMARAAAALSEEVARLLPPQATVLLLVGAGNNGGDALFAGAELARAGHRVHIVPTAARLHEEGLSAALDAGATVEGAAAADRLARSCDALVDGIVGTGSAGDPALRGAARAVVESVLPVTREPKHPLVVAVDLPSGVDPDDGSVPAPAVLPADITVTFGVMKAGLLRPPARAYAGRIIVVDIGIGAELAKMEPAAHYDLEEAETA
ncbi:NAD(P)H-hydrate epimerase [Salinibacterium sp. dk2585]|uniref:NAD(P)H-hydrate epimerase n=1 Tax=unclassified Salinibacterium TaxID=2632331 RepID=UPI0011C24A45|nr:MULTISPECIES: NAD(P)H-hydrate epimerase [unclassified Salinibacterium]QEE61545.1 NAD(P)H-hydrate epimerase [Salinibacterium sp. dk2585]TXK52486.1 NAD(P)H-hydrate epimerase [Salinibacterium sp. dk5596]